MLAKGLKHEKKWVYVKYTAVKLSSMPRMPFRKCSLRSVSVSVLLFYTADYTNVFSALFRVAKLLDFQGFCLRGQQAWLLYISIFWVMMFVYSRLHFSTLANFLNF